MLALKTHISSNNIDILDSHLSIMWNLHLFMHNFVPETLGDRRKQT